MSEVDEAQAKYLEAITVLSAWNAIVMVLGGLEMDQRLRVTRAMAIFIDGYSRKKPGEQIGREVSHAVAEALVGRALSAAELADIDAGLDDDEGTPPTTPEGTP